jgi:hypothetical protein
MIQIRVQRLSTPFSMFTQLLCSREERPTLVIGVTKKPLGHWDPSLTFGLRQKEVTLYLWRMDQLPGIVFCRTDDSI